MFLLIGTENWRIIKTDFWVIWFDVTAENIVISYVKSFTVDTLLSGIEKHTTSFKSGIGIKSFNFAYLFN